MKINNTESTFSLRGKVVLVTGGAGFLGSIFCSALATAGASVAIIDLDITKAKNLREKISDITDAAAFRCDVSNPKSVKKMVEMVIKHYGRIDLLVNNAATKTNNLDAFFNSFENYRYNDWKKVMSVNIDGMFLVAQEVGRAMIKQNISGSIVQVSSIYGSLAPDFRVYKNSFYLNREISSPAVYSVSKAAVIGLTKYLAAYWAKYRIRVNTLSPGGIESGQNKVFRKKYAARVPMNRMASQDEMTGTLVYLLSDASSYVTGQEIRVDGGLSVW